MKRIKRVLALFVTGAVLSLGLMMSDKCVYATGTMDSSGRGQWDAAHTQYIVDGYAVRGSQRIGEQLFLFDDNGMLVKETGLQKIDGQYYFFNDDHSLKTGAVKVKKKYYYFKNSCGVRYDGKGIEQVEGKFYRFNKKHQLKSGWYRDKNKKRYYFDKKTFAAHTGWHYVGKYKYYFNEQGKLRQDVRKLLTKEQKKSYVLKVNRTACCVTAYAKDGEKGYTIPVVAFVCSTGGGTPTGTFKTKDRIRWHTLMGPCWGQWCEHITDTVLFHSVFYNKPNDNRSLSVSAYNKLGTMASHGCVRLRAGDAKWIYDNCAPGTKVVIYNDKKNPGPFDKPKAEKLSAGHTWDPTDPTIK